MRANVKFSQLRSPLKLSLAGDPDPCRAIIHSWLQWLLFRYKTAITDTNNRDVYLSKRLNYRRRNAWLQNTQRLKQSI